MEPACSLLSGKLLIKKPQANSAAVQLKNIRHVYVIGTVI
jgi:hypothetical protein